MSSDFDRSWRRLKPEKRHILLRRRQDSDLSFVGSDSSAPKSLLYDTTVYVDIMQGRFTSTLKALIRVCDDWHSAVSESELASGCALLDPAHPGTRKIVKEIASTIERIPAHRTIAPDREIWRDAGILAGTMARIQKIAKTEHRRVLNDALIFSTARKHGHTVLTRNVIDFDLLQQLDPSGRVLFYKV